MTPQDYEERLNALTIAVQHAGRTISRIVWGLILTVVVGGVVAVWLLSNKTDEATQRAKASQTAIVKTDKTARKAAATASKTKTTADRADKRSKGTVRYLQGKQGSPGIRGFNGKPGARGPVGRRGRAGPPGLPGKDAPPVTAAQIRDVLGPILIAACERGLCGKDGREGPQGPQGAQGPPAPPTPAPPCGALDPALGYACVPPAP